MNKNCKYKELCEKENDRLGSLWAFKCKVPKGKKGFDNCTIYEQWELSEFAVGDGDDEAS